MPQNEMLRRLIAAYENNPNGFDWRKVSVTGFQSLTAEPPKCGKLVKRRAQKPK
jgi:hypothetical protein